MVSGVGSKEKMQEEGRPTDLKNCLFVYSRRSWREGTNLLSMTAEHTASVNLGSVLDISYTFTTQISENLGIMLLPH